MPEASSLQLPIAVPSPYTVEWLTRRLQHVIARSARAAAGYELLVLFISPCALGQSVSSQTV